MNAIGPDPALLTSTAFSGGDHIVAARAKDNAYALVYWASGKEFSVNLARLNCAEIAAWWFNPRTGTAIGAGAYVRPAAGEFREWFSPPVSGQDWLLVIDDAAREFTRPGALPAP